MTAEEYARVAKLGHTIEEDFRVAKSQCGLADYQVRNWYDWHHHITMSLIASWCLTQEVLCQKKDPGDNGCITIVVDFPFHFFAR